MKSICQQQLCKLSEEQHYYAGVINEICTFNADDVIPHLLLYHLIPYNLDEIVKGIDARMDAFKTLDLLAYCNGVSVYQRDGCTTVAERVHRHRHRR